MATSILPFNGSHSFVLHCDFCAKPSDKVLLLIASPSGSHICDECVELSLEIVEEKRAEAEE